MALFTELDVVNECIGTMGEAPLASLSDVHPLRGSAQRALTVANTREQAKGWWFNKELVTLAPDPLTGHITLPGDTIRVDPTNECLNYVQRGSRLYQSFAPSSTDKYKFTAPVDCWLIRCIPYQDLPPMAQNLVMVAATLDFQKNFDADRDSTDDLKVKYKDALIELNSEHIRNVNANRLRSHSMMRALGMITPIRAPLYQ